MTRWRRHVFTAASVMANLLVATLAFAQPLFIPLTQVGGHPIYVATKEIILMAPMPAVVPEAPMPWPGVMHICETSVTLNLVESPSRDTGGMAPRVICVQEPVTTILEMLQE